MSKVVETTLRDLRSAVKLSGDESYVVKYDPVGHLSARLLDASGTVPLAFYQVAVEIPGEGRVELKTDRDGRIFYPDVPFQDYELEVEGDEGTVKVSVPAVAARGQVHDRHVPSERSLFLDLELRGADERRLAKTAIVLEGGGKSFHLTSDDEGRIVRALPLPPATYRVKLAGKEVEVELPGVRVARIVAFPEEDDAAAGGES